MQVHEGGGGCTVVLVPQTGSDRSRVGVGSVGKEEGPGCVKEDEQLALEKGGGGKYWYCRGQRAVPVRADGG